MIFPLLSPLLQNSPYLSFWCDFLGHFLFLNIYIFTLGNTWLLQKSTLKLRHVLSISLTSFWRCHFSHTSSPDMLFLRSLAPSQEPLLCSRFVFTSTPAASLPGPSCFYCTCPGCSETSGSLAFFSQVQ